MIILFLSCSYILSYPTSNSTILSSILSFSHTSLSHLFSILSHLLSYSILSDPFFLSSYSIPSYLLSNPILLPILFSFLSHPVSNPAEPILFHISMKPLDLRKLKKKKILLKIAAEKGKYLR